MASFVEPPNNLRFSVKMKRIYTLLIFIIITHFSATGQVLGAPLYSFDFANGLPEGWDNQSLSGISSWEYRGPNTTPDYTVGARGSCSALAQSMASVTQTNGFMIYDSNYWDDADSICGDPGSGPDPAPHLAWITTSSMDLSANEGAVLTFQQQYRHFTGFTKVQVSNDGGVIWNDVATNSGPTSPNVQWKTVNISTYAAGESDVRIKFVFTGTYYWWLIDDITIYEPFPNDLKIDRVQYTTNEGITDPNPQKDLEYDKYPITMIPNMSIHAHASNIGSFNQTGVNLKAKVLRDGTQIFQSNTSTSVLNSGISSTYTLPGYTPPSVLGDYQIAYEMDQNETDNNPVNNFDTLDFKITPFTYARDEGAMENYFAPPPSYAEYLFEAGNFFQCRANNKICSSIAVSLAAETRAGTTFKGIIYKDDMETIVAETDIYTVNDGYLNEIGEEKTVTLDLLNQISLGFDSIYLVVVKSLSVTDPIYVCRSGISPEETSLVRYPDVNATFILLKTPMVRMNIFNVGQTPGCSDPQALNFFGGSTIDDGSCLYPGCTNEDALNYQPSTNFDNGSCIVGGCTNPAASNFNPDATFDNSTCIFLGCTNTLADNYNPTATQDDGTCIISGCTNVDAANYNPSANNDNGSCQFPGCMDTEADNYDPQANVDDNSCVFLGCTDSEATNFDPTALNDDGSCLYITASVATSVTSGCAPLSIVITNQTQTSSEGTCLFTINSNPVQVECTNSFDYVFDLPGTYTLVYTYSEAGITTEDEVTIVVNAIPEIPLIAYNDDTHEMSCTNCSNVDFEWSIDGTVIPGNSEVISTFLNNTYENGDYSLVVTNNANCYRNSSSLFVFEPYYTLSVGEGCEPLDIVLTDMTDDAGQTNCTLDFGDGTIVNDFTGSESHNYPVAGGYALSLTCSVDGINYSYAGNPVIVNFVISPILVNDETLNQVICINNTQFSELEWVIDGQTFNGPGPYPNTGSNYLVTGTTSSDCNASSQIVMIGAEELDGNNLSIYPNPASDQILVSSSTAIHEIRLYDSTGRMVPCPKLNGSITQITIDCAGLSAGLYNLNLDGLNRQIMIIR
jgi:hypothetical protein